MPSQSRSTPNLPTNQMSISSRLVFQQPTVIVARKDFPAEDLKEFISYAKVNAEKLNMGHAGVGSITFTLPLLLNSLLGIKPTMVPRRSSRLHVQRNRRHRTAGSDRDH